MITLIEPGNHGEEKSPSTPLSLSLHLPKDFEVKVFAGWIGLRKPLSKQMYKLCILYMIIYYQCNCQSKRSTYRQRHFPPDYEHTI